MHMHLWHLPVTKADVLYLYTKNAAGKNCRGNLPWWRINWWRWWRRLRCTRWHARGRCKLQRCRHRVGLLVDPLMGWSLFCGVEVESWRHFVVVGGSMALLLSFWWRCRWLDQNAQNNKLKPKTAKSKERYNDACLKLKIKGGYLQLTQHLTAI